MGKQNMLREEGRAWQSSISELLKVCEHDVPILTLAAIPVWGALIQTALVASGADSFCGS